MVFLGSLGSIVLLLLSPSLANSILKIPVVLQSETVRAFYLLSLSLPIVIVTAGLRGVLEAYQRFDLVNFIRIPMGVFSYVGPSLTAMISKDLFYVVLVLLAGRVIAFFVHCRLCMKVMPKRKNNRLLRMT